MCYIAISTSPHLPSPISPWSSSSPLCPYPSSCFRFWRPFSFWSLRSFLRKSHQTSRKCLSTRLVLCFVVWCGEKILNVLGNFTILINIQLSGHLTRLRTEGERRLPIKLRDNAVKDIPSGSKEYFFSFHVYHRMDDLVRVLLAEFEALRLEEEGEQPHFDGLSSLPSCRPLGSLWNGSRRAKGRCYGRGTLLPRAGYTPKDFSPCRREETQWHHFCQIPANGRNTRLPFHLLLEGCCRVSV